MGRTENVEIFEHTRMLCQTDAGLIAAIRNTNQSQEVILETDGVEKTKPRFDAPAEIIVSKKRSFEAAQAYKGLCTCVLNFASATNPGGGVAWGATAQEECLCRCSTLYANLTARKLWHPFYAAHREQNNPLYNDDCIYTPGVVVFKTDTREPELLPQDAWWNVNVITCAAPNLRPDRDGNIRVRISNDELFKLHVKRMRRILDIAAQKGNDVVILGAYGCGAFKNPPAVVAAAMRQVAEEYCHHFRTIEFAVYCSPRDDQNYRVFQQTFCTDDERIDAAAKKILQQYRHAFEELAK